MAQLFGIEIEFVYGPTYSGTSPARLCEALREAGIVVNDASYTHAGFSRDAWTLKRDGSVQYGGEIVSPPLDFSDAEAREQINTVAKVLQATGANSDESAGIHVHVECRDFTPKQLAACLRFVYKFEDALFRIASSGWESFRNPYYTRPITDQMALDAMKIRTPEDLIRHWTENDIPRYMALNIQPWSRQGTLEFRLFNSTLNPKRLQAYIAIACAIVNDARLGYSRSTKKHFKAGYMKDNGPNAEKAMLLKLCQIFCYGSQMSKEDWKLIRFCWADSQPQSYEAVHGAPQFNYRTRQTVSPF